MTAAEYYHRQRSNLLLRYGPLGPIWRDGLGVVFIPTDPAILTEMVWEPPTREAEAWLRRRLAELDPMARGLPR